MRIPVFFTINLLETLIAIATEHIGNDNKTQFLFMFVLFTCMHSVSAIPFMDSEKIFDNLFRKLSLSIGMTTNLNR